MLFVLCSEYMSSAMYLLVCVTAGKTGLEKEQEFISKCMESLMMASANLEKDAHSSLTIIERGLLLLKTHLEAFRRRYTLRLCHCKTTMFK